MYIIPGVGARWTRAIVTVSSGTKRASSSALSLGHHIDDDYPRLSKIWAPTGGFAASAAEDSHAKLIRAGFLRQAHSGIFHMLPLGLRVQQKIEKLVVKHMALLGASRLDMSSISSEELWIKSGRLSKVNSELFRFKDRKGASYLLGPTHEEEITSLVGDAVKSYKELPVRLYQITRKYRDELRPRHGLLRSREFVMKDLYTFDATAELALSTYHQVREAYTNLFSELKIPFLVAEADSGDMGGNLSHEFHFLTPMGEDNVISCDSCDYIANEELADYGPAGSSPSIQQSSSWEFVPSPSKNDRDSPKFTVWRAVTKDRKLLVNVWHPSYRDVNIHAIKRIVADLDTGAENPIFLWMNHGKTASEGSSLEDEKQILNIFDNQLPSSIIKYFVSSSSGSVPVMPVEATVSPFAVKSTTYEGMGTRESLSLTCIQDGDQCVRCKSGALKVEKAIELGHTFFLGSRYSNPLNATIDLPAHFSNLDRPQTSAASTQSSSVSLQMGCHGIGVSRMIGAVAESLADDKGLIWPRVIAPYDVAIIPTSGLEGAAIDVYRTLVSVPTTPSLKGLDLVIDDRKHSFPWKMRDADLVGYPVVVVVGRAWKTTQLCEVQCRRLGIKEDVRIADLRGFLSGLLSEL